MRTDAISNTPLTNDLPIGGIDLIEVTPDVRQGVAIDPPEHYRLSGRYQLSALGVGVEVEITEASGVRSCVRLVPGASVLLSLPSGVYSFHVERRGSRLAPGSLRLRAVMAAERRRMLARRVLGVIAQPKQWFGVMRSLLARLGAQSDVIRASRAGVISPVAAPEALTMPWGEISPVFTGPAGEIGEGPTSGWVLLCPAGTTLNADAPAILTDWLVTRPDEEAVLIDLSRVDRPSFQAEVCRDRLLAAPLREAAALIRATRLTEATTAACLLALISEKGEGVVAHLPVVIGTVHPPPAVSAAHAGTVAVFAPAQVRPVTGVSIIIPTRTRHDDLKAAVVSLFATIRVPFELIVVDNGSDSPQMKACLEEIRRRPDTQVLRIEAPFNFSALCNAGARQARHDALLFFNDDAEALKPGWLEALMAPLGRADVGITGARLLYPDRSLQHGGVASNLLPGPGHPWRCVPQDVWQDHPVLDVCGQVDAVTGACLMIRHDLFRALGGFDEDAFPVSLNDVDLCLRAAMTGQRTLYVPEATLLHKEGRSRRRDDDAMERARRQAELNVFVARHPRAARYSVFFPDGLRRDSDTGAPWP